MIYYANLLSPSMRRVWIEIWCPLWQLRPLSSPSMRRVWIEIMPGGIIRPAHQVTLHAEGVD